jgi:3-methyladenine DNA glycosylase AlkD
MLPLIAAAADDERNFVKKAVNWALRQIGKRNPTLCGAAIATAELLRQRPEPSARWIAAGALRELRQRGT